MRKEFEDEYVCVCLIVCDETLNPARWMMDSLLGDCLYAGTCSVYKTVARRYCIKFHILMSVNGGLCRLYTPQSAGAKIKKSISPSLSV